MSADSAEALRAFTTALEAHLAAISGRRGPEDAAVDDAYDALGEAFERYEEALDEEHGETLPFVVDDSDDEDFDTEDEDADEERADLDDDGDNGLDDDIVEFDLTD